MGPTRSDPLARFIVRRCRERNARQSDIEGTHRAAASRAFDRDRDEFRNEASNPELRSSRGEESSKPANWLMQDPTTPIFMLLCIMMIVVALVATPIFVLLCVIMIFGALVASLVFELYD